MVRVDPGCPQARAAPTGKINKYLASNGHFWYALLQFVRLINKIEFRRPRVRTLRAYAALFLPDRIGKMSYQHGALVRRLGKQAVAAFVVEPGLRLAPILRAEQWILGHFCEFEKFTGAQLSQEDILR